MDDLDKQMARAVSVAGALVDHPHAPGVVDVCAGVAEPLIKDRDDVIRRLLDAWEVTKERADGFRYWVRPCTAGWEPLTDRERAVIEDLERD